MLPCSSRLSMAAALTSWDLSTPTRSRAKPPRLQTCIPGRAPLALCSATVCFGYSSVYSFTAFNDAKHIACWEHAIELDRCFTVCDAGHQGMKHLLCTCILVEPGKCATLPCPTTHPTTHPASCMSCCCCRGNHETSGGYTLTRLTSLLSTLMASPGATTRFASAGLLGEALLSIAGLSAVEIGRSHLSGECLYTIRRTSFLLGSP